MTDADALHAYVTTASGEAFASLVRAHIDLVHAAARRQVRDPHLADDVTQAVFVILARRAGSVRQANLLPGWLLKTTRYAALNAVRVAAHRRHHERQAAAMNSPTIAPDHDTSEINELLPGLDEHLSRLSDKDRTAVVMRFFHDKPVRDIAAVLGVSEVAAQKRVIRAVDKLRKLFARRQGRAFTPDSLTAALAAVPPLLPVPPSLAPAILSSSTSAPQVELIAGSALRSMFWTGAKLATTTAIAASLIIVACGSALLLNNKPVAASQPATRAASALAPPLTTPAVTTPAVATPATPATGGARPSVQFPNTTMGALEPDAPGYTHGVDDAVRRTPQSDPAAVLVCSGPAAGAARMGASHFLTPAAPYHGERVRIRGYVKTENLAAWAGLSVHVVTLDGHEYASDNMATRAIRGTTDWKRYESVVDVSPRASTIMLGVCLSGGAANTGKVWADGFTLERVGKDVPLTDDTLWHSFSWRGVYAEKVDPDTRRNRRPTTMFASTAPDVRGDEWGLYDYAIRDLDAFRGQRVKVTMWLKCEKVTHPSGPHLRVYGANFRRLADEGQRARRPLRGTMDWRKYEAIADVPEEADVIYPGITMNGSGKIWVDEVKVEVVP